MIGNNRGQSTMFLFLIITLMLVFVLFFVIGGIVIINSFDALDQNISVGQVNLKEINDDTFGQFKNAYVNNAEFYGLSVIFGMVMGLFLAAYFTRNTFPKWGMILDIFIILAAFIFALYISATYSLTINALYDAGQTFAEDYMEKTSFFIVNLHIFVVIIGVVCMVLFHSSIPKKIEEGINRGPQLQGI